MPGTTPNLALRYPTGTDQPDGAGAIYNLANDVDAHLGSGWTNFTAGFQSINLTWQRSRWRYRQDRVLVDLAGTVTSATSGQFFIGIPPTAQYAGALISGTAKLLRGATPYRLLPEFYSPGLIQFFYGNPEAPVSGISPAAWASGDKFSALLEYDLT